MNLSIIGKVIMLIGAAIALVIPLIVYGSIIFFIGVAILLISEGAIASKLLWILLTVLIYFIISITIFFFLSYQNNY